MTTTTKTDSGWEHSAEQAAIPLLEAGLSESATREILVRFGYAADVGSLFSAVDMIAAPRVGGMIRYGASDLYFDKTLRAEYEQILDTWERSQRTE